MINEFSRTELLIGDKAVNKLKNSSVAVFGIGGVGGHTAEALARSGVGELHFFDNDTVSISNINRQIIALHSTVGEYKVDVMKERALDINPNAKVFAHKIFINENIINELDFSKFDYVIDAIDTVSAKLLLIKLSKENKIPVISAMGAGNKLDPTKFVVTDISKTEACPLARVMRKKLKEMDIKGVKVVYSTELALKPLQSTESKGTAGRPVPGSCAFVPSVSGLIIASEVIKDLTKGE